MDDGFRGLTLTNTMTRRKEAFRPRDWREGTVAEADRCVRMYVCGPTVYDFAHIGNARPVIVFDVLFRLLRHLYGEAHVVYARNITDVDDKINARAARDYPGLPLNEAIRKVTTATADQFHADIAALGAVEPTFEPRATEFVTGRADGHDMVSMIETLIAKGYAYEAGGEVLFDVTSMPAYGRLSNRKLDEQQAGARVAVESHKKNPADFVLWKLSDETEPGWESPWGRGRPGWHIECSVMSAALLGHTFDIHGGGLDLIFPHHENEIAQSCCAHGTEAMADVWMHNGFVQVEGRKMAKSDGNFVTIHDLLHTETFGGRRWPGPVLRLAMLMTHYREPIDFSVKRLEEAEGILQRWADAAWRDGILGTEPKPENTPLMDDLNTSAFISSVHQYVKPAKAGDDFAISQIQAAMRILGFENISEMSLQALSAIGRASGDRDIERNIEERLAFIREKNWAEADRIRDELAAQGIQLKDGKDPETGERITSWEFKR
ncbi:MAG: cysteine--tRNA ligase [Fulvimarina manganoxydans]|uniref:cysteine--tRNA ligase n=1 Tax=Fulvimarina manganoxydans TaxID=937218 RepID=UPI002357223B|nr:cysteine--tRNA ligase [Fulvimarina manganoxydans]MCK5934106.1 cysteine--tRNA ligase [Fulvimarina manganoxydans]